MKHLKFLLTTILLLVVTTSVYAYAINLDMVNSTSIVNFIQNNNAFTYLSAFFVIGILLSFTPCVLPMVPILSGIIVGQESINTPKAFKLSLSYVLGMASTYALAGVLVSLMGTTLQNAIQTPYVIVGFSLVFVIMALSMLNLLNIRVPRGLNINFKKTGKSSYIRVFVMGAISTLIVSPCVTAPLIGVLSFIGQQGSVIKGGVMLFVMALGMGAPLLLVGAGYGKYLPKTGNWMLNIKKLFGFMMLAMAIWMLSRVLPVNVITLLWGILLIGGSIAMGTLNTQTKLHGKVLQAIGVLMIIVGGNIGYQTTVISNSIGTQPPKNSSFIIVHNSGELTKELKTAAAAKKPVLLEFYADWCSVCKKMDADVFNQQDVQQKTANFTNIRVDISAPSDEVSNIVNEYGILGTPTILFFNSQGKPIPELNSAGFISKNSMLEILSKAEKS